jgi:hypothetical protein
MSFTTDEHCNIMYLVLGAAENNAALAARTFAMSFPNLCECYLLGLLTND